MSDAEPKPMTKTDLKQLIANKCGITGNQASDVLNLLESTAIEQVQTLGVFTIPGLVKITKVHKPAKPSRETINPFTKEPMTTKEKPATNVVKVKPLKALKDSVA